MNSFNTAKRNDEISAKRQKRLNALEKFLIYAGAIICGAFGVLIIYKIFEFLFTLIVVVIGAIGPIGRR